MDNTTINSMAPIVRYGVITYTIFLIVFGTLGNILLLLTLFYKRYHRVAPVIATEMTAVGAQQPNSVKPIITPRPPIRQTRTQHLSVADELLGVLTVTDSICLWIVVSRYAIHILTDYDVRTYSIAACKLHTFITMVISDASTAILCIFASHRALCIRYPLAIHTWLTRGRIKICIAFAFTFIVCKHLAVFSLFTLTPTEIGYKCDIREDTSVYNQVYYNFEFATHAILGYAWLIVANILLCVSLAYTRRLQSATQTTSKNSGCDGLQIARIILLFSVIQVITAVPFYILIELSGLYNLQLIPDSSELTVYYVLTLAIFTNCGINFYLLLAISERFRQDTKLLLEVIRDRLPCCYRDEDDESKSRKQSGFQSELD